MNYSKEQVGAHLVNVACMGLKTMMQAIKCGIQDIAATGLKEDIDVQRENVIAAEAKLNVLVKSLAGLEPVPNSYLATVTAELTEIADTVSDLKKIDHKLYKPQLKALVAEAEKCADELHKIHLNSKGTFDGEAIEVGVKTDSLFPGTASNIFVGLHLTDLHLGAKKTGIKWDKLQQKFFEDLDHLEQRFQIKWDVVLFTGDLAHSGEKQQFEEFDKFLERLYSRWDDAPLPPFLAVPGNHDLKQYEFFDEHSEEFSRLSSFHQQDAVRTGFFKDDSALREYANNAFKEYRDWWLECKYRPNDIVDGVVAGDFSFKFKKESKEIGFVGLNSAYLNLWGKKSHSNFKPNGNMAIEEEQLASVCNGEPISWLKGNDLNMVLTHHPVSWINNRCEFESTVLDPNYVTFHYCGHEHQPVSQLGSRNAGPKARTFQGRSFYGRQWIENEQKLERIQGYAIFAIDLSDAPKFRYWPRVANPHHFDKIIPDHLGFDLCRTFNDEGTAAEGFNYVGD